MQKSGIKTFKSFPFHEQNVMQSLIILQTNVSFMIQTAKSLTAKKIHKT